MFQYIDLDEIADSRPAKKNNPELSTEINCARNGTLSLPTGPSF